MGRISLLLAAFAIGQGIACGRINFDPTATDGGSIDAQVADASGQGQVDAESPIQVDASMPLVASIGSTDTFVGSNTHSSGDFLHEIAYLDNTLYFGGAFGETITVGATPHSTTLPRAVLIGARSLTGTALWSQTYGTAGFNQAFDVKVNSTGVYFCGFFEDNINLAAQTLSISGIQASYVAKFPLGGGVAAWSTGWGGAGFDYARSLALRSDGSTITAGHIEDTVSVQGQQHTSAGARDVIVVALNPDGAREWVWRVGDIGRDVAYGVTLGPEGAIYVTGSFEGSVDFGDGANDSAGDGDIFVAKLDADGALQWVQTFGTAATDRGRAIAVTGNGTVVVAGSVGGQIDFGLGLQPHVANDDIFLLGLDGTTGAAIWNRTFGGAGDDLVNGLELNASDALVATGVITAAVNAGGGPVPFTTGEDVLVVSYEPGGAHRWSTSFGGTGNAYPQGLESVSEGRVFVSGQYEGQLSPGSASISSGGTWDTFLVEVLIE